jgi:hypothetical protein
MYQTSASSDAEVKGTAIEADLKKQDGKHRLYGVRPKPHNRAIYLIERWRRSRLGSSPECQEGRLMTRYLVSVAAEICGWIRFQRQPMTSPGQFIPITKSDQGALDKHIPICLIKYQKQEQHLRDRTGIEPDRND